MRESAEYGKEVKDKKISSVNKAKKLESSISNGRKIFRLFLFLNESAELYELIKYSKYTLPLRVLKIISTCCSFIYYFTDNIVYLSNMGFVNAFVPHTTMKWKQIKNIFSFTKTILEIIIAIYTIYEKKKEELQISEKLQKFTEETLRWDSEANVLVRNLIILRREAIFNRVEALIYIMRMFMLVSSLKVVGHSILNPIFVSGCGIMQAFANVFKSMKGKKNFYKLTIEDIQERDNQTPVAPKTILVKENHLDASPGKRERLLSDIAENHI